MYLYIELLKMQGVPYISNYTIFFAFFKNFSNKKPPGIMAHPGIENQTKNSYCAFQALETIQSMMCHNTVGGNRGELFGDEKFPNVISPCII